MLQPMKLIKTLFIHLKVNFQYSCAANTLVPNLKVCRTKKSDRNTKSEQILSSDAALPRHVCRGVLGVDLTCFINVLLILSSHNLNINGLKLSVGTLLQFYLWQCSFEDRGTCQFSDVKAPSQNDCSKLRALSVFVLLLPNKSKSTKKGVGAPLKHV